MQKKMRTYFSAHQCTGKGPTTAAAGLVSPVVPAPNLLEAIAMAGLSEKHKDACLIDDKWYITMHLQKI
jgi:hypothetical protein